MAVRERGQLRRRNRKFSGQLAPVDQPGAGDESQTPDRVVDGLGGGVEAKIGRLFYAEKRWIACGMMG